MIFLDLHHEGFPPPWHDDAPPPAGPAPSAPNVAHVNATKGDQGRRRDPGSSPSGEPLKVAPPSASPAEPSPGHGSSEAGRRRERVDGEDAGRAYRREQILYARKK